MNGRSRVCRPVAALLAALMLASAITPAAATAGSPADDLKQIEYRYYFRGKYAEAVEALRTFLARVDLAAADATRAREFLAASYVLGGKPDQGRAVFLELITGDPAYAGPDPAVFKPDVVSVYTATRAEYAAARLREAPATTLPASSSSPGEPAATRGKPVYRQWWFYAGAAAVAAIAVGVAAAGGDEDAPASGTLVIGVNVK